MAENMADIQKQKAVLRICNQQTIDGRPEKIELEVPGCIFAQDGQIVLEYEEYDEEQKKTQTTVRAENHKFVSVTRCGALTSQMLFQQGRRNTSVYSTPYGDLIMGIFTKRITTDIPLEGKMSGNLSFAYTTDFSGQSPIENAMTLVVRVL